MNVLIAEDDFRVASIHEQFLLKIGGVNIVGIARNAEETIHLLKEYPVQLLLLDIYMPDELGIHLLPKIHELFPQLDIIMITAATDKSMLEKAVRNGVFNYLIKPVTIERLKDCLESYKRKKMLLDDRNEINQAIVDIYLGNETQSASSNDETLPKGIDALTLKKVKSILKTEEGITAEEMGEKMGASRTTARRYLEYLISINEISAELQYGIVGRPERKYYLSI